MLKRHHWIVRLTHWVSAIALFVMIGSGLRIFAAYPRFARRGESFCCYPFENSGLPHWVSNLWFGGWLAGARNWHFAMMWILVLCGVVYVSFLFFKGSWREVVPRRGDARDALEMIKFYLFVRRDHPPQGKHNALQKMAYFSLPVLAFLAVATGIAIWKPVQLGWLTAIFGGYVWARYWHFVVMVLIVILTTIHIFMVFAVDPFAIRSMITGRYDTRRSPQARNARPFFWRRPRPSEETRNDQEQERLDSPAEV